SGLVCAAFTLEAKALYRKAFSGGVEKSYLALVSAAADPGQSEVSLYFPPTEARKVQASVMPVPGAKEVRFQLHVLSCSSAYSLLRIRTNQGLRHVVRAGLAALGHPLVGDRLYGGESLAPFH